MGYSKTQKILFAFLCLFIILFPFWCVRGLCAESEDVSFSIVNNLGTSDGSFVSANNNEIKYFLAEPGYKYSIVCHYNFTVARVVVSSASVPAAGVPYTSVYSFTENGQVFEFTVSENTYVAIDVNFQDGYLTVDRQDSTGMGNAVRNLSDNVGPNIWESFTNSLPFVLPLVLVCFGMYLISYFVNKNSKGV